MDFFADKAEGIFQVAAGCLECVGVDGQRCAEDDKGGTIGRAGDGLLKGKSTYRLDWDFHSADDFPQLVQRARHPLTPGGDSPAFVVTDVMDNEVAAKLFELAGSLHHALAAQVVPHDGCPEILARLDDAFDGFLVCPCHDDDMGGSGLGHHLGFQVATVHGFEVGDDGDAGEGFAEFADAVEPFGQDQGCASFKPVDPGTECHGSGFERFVDVGKVKGDLDDGFHSGEVLGS